MSGIEEQEYTVKDFIKELCECHFYVSPLVQRIQLIVFLRRSDNRRIGILGVKKYNLNEPLNGPEMFTFNIFDYRTTINSIRRAKTVCGRCGGRVRYTKFFDSFDVHDIVSRLWPRPMRRRW